MKKLSVCMIIKNEEPVLRRCLSCAVQFSDELIVVDTGSTDKSVEIACEYTDNVYMHLWQNSFAEARNYSYLKATGDYIMWLDADEVVTDENVKKINELKQETTDADAVFMITKFYAESGITSYFLRDRIIRRSAFRGWCFDVHEAIPIEPWRKKIYRSDIEILHKKEVVNEPERNINIFNGIINEGKPLSIRENTNLIAELSCHRKAEEALSLFRRICASLPPSSYAYAFTHLMVELHRTERWSECLELIGESEKHIVPTPRMIYTKGVCMDRLGESEAAEKLYHAALTAKEDPLTMSTCYTGYNDYFPYLRLAELAKKRGDRWEAMRFLNCARSAYPKDISWKITQLGIMLNIENLSKNEKEKKSMAKTEKELNELKQEMERLNEKLKELSPEDFERFAGGGSEEPGTPHFEMCQTRYCNDDPGQCPWKGFVKKEECPISYRW